MKKVDLGRYNNDRYKKQIGASRPKRLIWYFFNLFFFRNAYIPFSSLKIFLLKSFGAKIGSNILIKPSVNIKYPWKLVIGSNVWIGEQVWIDNLALVQIGDNACISQGAMLLTGNHDYTAETFNLIVKPIILHEGVWIGAKSIVCPGVTANSHAVLTVNSVATKDLEPFSIYQGNPAQKIKERIVK